VTSVTEVRGASIRLPLYVAPSGDCYYNTLLCCDYLSSSSVLYALSLYYACIWSSGIILSP